MPLPYDDPCEGMTREQKEVYYQTHGFMTIYDKANPFGRLILRLALRLMNLRNKLRESKKNDE